MHDWLEQGRENSEGEEEGARRSAFSSEQGCAGSKRGTALGSEERSISPRIIGDVSPCWGMDGAVTLLDSAAGSAFLAGLSTRAGLPPLPPAPSVGSLAACKTSPGTWQEPSAPSELH